ncbi:hypothetical protein RZE82_07155 [Mollicutes bacterium LVI A0039]|nr:hypothetical protein RZE82_07155 [Mollicutes bacterium LVI A0039]
MKCTKLELENLNIAFDLLCNCRSAMKCDNMVLELCDTVSVKEIKNRCERAVKILQQGEMEHHELEISLKCFISLDFDVQYAYKKAIEEFIWMFKTNSISKKKLYNINVLLQLIIIWG